MNATSLDDNPHRFHARLRFLSTLQSICTRYERDFSEEADEIDLETLEIVKTKGHLARASLRPFGKFNTEKNEDVSEESEGDGMGSELFVNSGHLACNSSILALGDDAFLKKLEKKDKRYQSLDPLEAYIQRKHRDWRRLHKKHVSKSKAKRTWEEEDDLWSSNDEAAIELLSTRKRSKNNRALEASPNSSKKQRIFGFNGATKAQFLSIHKPDSGREKICEEPETLDKSAFFSESLIPPSPPTPPPLVIADILSFFKLNETKEANNAEKTIQEAIGKGILDPCDARALQHQRLRHAELLNMKTSSTSVELEEMTDWKEKHLKLLTAPVELPLLNSQALRRVKSAPIITATSPSQGQTLLVIDIKRSVSV